MSLLLLVIELEADDLKSCLKIFSQLLIFQAREIGSHRSGVFASKVIPGSPVEIELIDFGTKEMVQSAGADAVLVGEALMRQSDVQQALEVLIAG